MSHALLDFMHIPSGGTIVARIKVHRGRSITVKKGYNNSNSMQQL